MFEFDFLRFDPEALPQEIDEEMAALVVMFLPVDRCFHLFAVRLESSRQVPGVWKHLFMHEERFLWMEV